jgi:hypothetical protein
MRHIPPISHKILTARRMPAADGLADYADKARSRKRRAVPV